MTPKSEPHTTTIRKLRQRISVYAGRIGGLEKRAADLEAARESLQGILGAERLRIKSLEAQAQTLRDALSAVAFAVELESHLVPSLNGKAWTAMRASVRAALEAPHA